MAPITSVEICRNCGHVAKIIFDDGHVDSRNEREHNSSCKSLDPIPRPPSDLSKLVVRRQQEAWDNLFRYRSPEDRKKGKSQ
jgi:hypothetical protein